MSYTCNFTITLTNRRVPYVELLRRLITAGWGTENQFGGITYFALGATGYPEPVFESRGATDDILTGLEVLESKGEFFAMELFWEKSDFGIWIGFNISELKGQDAIVIGYRLTRRVLAAAPPVTDHNWYLERLLPEMVRAECEIAGIDWKEFS